MIEILIQYFGDIGDPLILHVCSGQLNMDVVGEGVPAQGCIVLFADV